MHNRVYPVVNKGAGLKNCAVLINVIKMFKNFYCKNQLVKLLFVNCVFTLRVGIGIGF